MPIEIRELIIKTQITEEGFDSEAARDPQWQAENERKIIDRCVSEVLKKLKRKIER